MLRIVVVDDEPSVLRIMSLHLEATGYEVHAFGDGKEALGWLRLNSADVLIIDEKMRGLSGTDVVEELRSLGGGHVTHVILMSGHPVEGLTVNADTFLQKPFSPGKLDAALRQIAERADVPAAGAEQEAV